MNKGEIADLMFSTDDHRKVNGNQHTNFRKGTFKLA
jgi:hypothetical protein